MKNLVLAATVALGLLVSCSKDYNEIGETSKGAVVNISFNNDTATRASYGTTETAEAESWEKELKKITLFVFDQSENMIIKRSFLESEISARQATLILPDVVSGSVCEFFAVANYDVSNINSKGALITKIECNTSRYNGSYSVISTRAQSAEGFVLSGSTSQTVAEAGSKTDVVIPLKRTVAKIAFQTKPSALFGTRYQGTVRVNSIELNRTVSETYLCKTTFSTGGSIGMLHQGSKFESGAYRNLFYVYENDALPSGSYVTATIDATYDVDGDFNTRQDQTPMTYEVKLEGNSNGAITRNCFYRVDISINGLNGNEAALAITPAEWESPVTQSVEVGE